MKSKGMVLLMVLAVLTLLCLLGLMFVLMANMERATARAYLDMVRVKMVAQSGVHAAMINTRTLLLEKGFDIAEMKYYGEDLNGDETITLGPLYQYENQDNDNILQTLDCPLYRAVRPSFMIDRNSDGILDEQDLIEVAGKKVGVSGVLPGPYNQTVGAYYVTKVEDLSGRLYLNMEDHPYMREILENLTTALGKGKSLGGRIFLNRPYVSMGDLISKAKLSEAEYELVAPYLTTYAWCDKTVLKPDRFFDRIGSALSGDIFSWEEIRPKMIYYPSVGIPGSYDYRIVGRAPVNINTAAKPLLIALLTGLKGKYLDEDANFTWYPDMHMHLIAYYYTYLPNEPELGKKGSLGKLKSTNEIDFDKATKIAEAIIQNRRLTADALHPWRGQFRSWQQFAQFCDQVLWQGKDHGISPNFLSPQESDVLKANFNPNSNLSEFNPPYQRLFWVSKSNLMKWSTEFCFFPNGYFEIASLGRLLGPHQEIRAESQITAQVKLFGLYKETSQAEFLYEYWHDHKPIRDEIIQGNPDPGIQPTSDNLTLQVFPEVPDKTLWQKYYTDVEGAPLYDGYITLATTENYPAGGYVGQCPDFAVHFSSSKKFEADNPSHQFIEDVHGPYYSTLMCSRFTEKPNWYKKPGKLFPDGVYSELDSVAEYDYRPANLDVMTVSLWIKPHFFPESASKCRTWFTYQAFLNDHERNALGMGLSVFQGETVIKSQANPIAPLGIYSIPGDTEDSLYDGVTRLERWDNASFCAGGMATRQENRSFGGGIISPCLNHIPHQCTVNPAHPSHDTCPDDPDIGHYRTDIAGTKWETIFRAGKWLHLGWVRHAWPGEATTVLSEMQCTGVPKQPYNQIERLFINGRKVQVWNAYWINHGGMHAIWEAYNRLKPGLRLGERRNQFNPPGAIREEIHLNGAPDGTIDEVLIWDGLDIEAGSTAVKNVWEQGRFYRGNTSYGYAGYFRSRPIDLAQEIGVPTTTPMVILMVNWSQYIPEFYYSRTTGQVSKVIKNLPPASRPTCEIEILDAADPSTVLGQRPATGNPPDPGGELIKTSTGNILVVNKPVRYQVKFCPYADLNDVIIDPMIFDDITIIYYSVPKFLSWAYRR